MAKIDDDPASIAIRQATEYTDYPREVAIILGAAAAVKVHPVAGVLLAAAISLRELFSHSAKSQRYETFFELLLNSINRVDSRVNELDSKVK
jgi:hypothetical protein